MLFCVVIRLVRVFTRLQSALEDPRMNVDLSREQYRTIARTFKLGCCSCLILICQMWFPLFFLQPCLLLVMTKAFRENTYSRKIALPSRSLSCKKYHSYVFSLSVISHFIFPCPEFGAAQFAIVDKARVLLASRGLVRSNTMR